MQQTANDGACNCPHHKMGPLLIILLGLLWLLSALNVISINIVSIILPIIVIAIGLMVLFKGECRCCNKGKDSKSSEMNK
jgi:hypothetical protein